MNKSVVICFLTIGIGLLFLHRPNMRFEGFELDFKQKLEDCFAKDTLLLGSMHFTPIRTTILIRFIEERPIKHLWVTDCTFFDPRPFEIAVMASPIETFGFVPSNPTQVLLIKKKKMVMEGLNAWQKKIMDSE